MVQDSLGFVWFGTLEGLSRFDGTSFKNYYADIKDSLLLPGRDITCLYEYKKGQLLFLSAGRVWCMNTFTKSFFQPLQFRNNRWIYLINKSEDGKYFFAGIDTCYVSDHSLKITDTIVPPTKLKNKFITIVELDSNRWLVYHDTELFFYTPQNKKYSHLLVPREISADQALVFRYYDKKNKWIYFSKYMFGLYKFSSVGVLLHTWHYGKTAYDLGNGSVSYLTPGNDSTLLVAAQDAGGLNIINSNTNIVNVVVNEPGNPSSLVNNTINAIYQDGDKNTWLATDGGISKLTGSSSYISCWHRQFLQLNETGELNGLLKGPDGNMYVSFYNGGTYQVHSFDNSVSQLKKNVFNRYGWSLHVHDNKIYQTGSGIFITSYDTRTGKYEKLNDVKKYFSDVEIVTAGFKQRNGDEWYSGNHGGGFIRISAKDGCYHIYKKDGPQGRFTISYYTNHVETDNGDLWFGVIKTHKLLHWIRHTDSFEEMVLDSVPGINFSGFSGVTSMVSDKENNIWIGFSGTGLVRYNPAKNVARHYTIQNGLPTNYIVTLSFDNSNRLWIGTTKGLSCLLADKEQFITFNKEDGLAEDSFNTECSYFDSTTNKLWMGVRNTLMNFNPDTLLLTNKHYFPIYIDEIFTNGKKLAYQGAWGSHVFNASQNNVQFQFIGVDIDNGKDMEYSYRLIGADNQWQYNGAATSASYANLDPGNYVFSVRARRKGDKMWIEMKDPFPFFIETPWNKSWWFITAICLTIAMVMFAIIRAYYLRKIEKQSAIIEKQLAVSNERNRIAADMHDDLGSGLTKIAYLSQMSLEKGESKDHLRNIRNTSSQLVENMSEIIWALKEENNTVEDLVTYIKAYTAEYCAANNLECFFKMPETFDSTEVEGVTRRNIYLAVKEVLHNVIKHADATNVFVEVSVINELMICIHDNGNGISIEKKQTLFGGNGLQNIKKRMMLIGGSVNIENNNGTTILLRMPL